MRRFVLRCVQVAGLGALVSMTTCTPPRRVAQANTVFEEPPPPPSPCADPSRESLWKSLEGGRERASGDFGGRAVVLVVLDGARWQEVYEGVDPARAAMDGMAIDTVPMPHLRALMRDRGVALGAPGHGAIVRASGPNFVSLPGYTEIFTGRSPVACADNECARTRIPTIADELRACSPNARDVAVFASWPEIQKAATAHPGELVLSTGRHARSQDAILRENEGTAQMLDAAVDVDPYPGYGDFRPDKLTAQVALHYLETEEPRFLFMGLGEPDEQAHRGSYIGYIDALHAADESIDALMKTLDRMGERGKNTTVFITADHGRADTFRDHGGEYPESARVWLVALGGDVAGGARGAIDAREDRRLADVAPTIRAMLGLTVSATASDSSVGRAIPELLR